MEFNCSLLEICIVAISLFMLGPTLQSIAEIVLPGKNQTYPMPYPIHNIMNLEKYHKIELVHSYFSTFFFVSVVVAIDTMFITYMSHCCGMFAVLR